MSDKLTTTYRLIPGESMYRDTPGNRERISVAGADELAFYAKDEVDTRIAELERICELNADALALYDKRGELIATLNEVRSRQEVRIAELERLVDSLSRVIADTTEGKGE